MTHDHFDDQFADAAKSYNAPPETPREAMWDAISRARDERKVIPIASRRAAPLAPRWLLPAIGIAAVLVMGIAIGRATRGPSQVTPVASTQTPTTPTPTSAPRDSAPIVPEQQVAATVTELPSRIRERSAAVSRATANRERGRLAEMSDDDAAYRLAVVKHLTRTEVMLTGFGAQTRQSTETKVDVQLATLSRELLGTTRLLLARRNTDPTLTRLLEDLELVLMQISQYANDGRRTDLDALNQSIEKRNVLPKIRSTIPGALSSGT